MIGVIATIIRAVTTKKGAHFILILAFLLFTCDFSLIANSIFVHKSEKNTSQETFFASNLTLQLYVAAYDELLWVFAM